MTLHHNCEEQNDISDSTTLDSLDVMWFELIAIVSGLWQGLISYYRFKFDLIIKIKLII